MGLRRSKTELTVNIAAVAGLAKKPLAAVLEALRRPGAIIFIAASALAIAVAGGAGVAKTTSSSGYAAVFGNFAERGADWNPRTPAEIVSVSFSLPVDAYVYITSSGQVTFVRDKVASPGMAQFWIAMDDKGRRADWDTYRFHEGAFSLSSMYKLKQGRHTASLMGSPHAGNYNFGYMDAHIIAIATQEGALGGSTWFTPE